VLQWSAVRYYENFIQSLNNMNKRFILKPNTQMLFSILKTQIQKREAYLSTVLDCMSCIVLPAVVSYFIGSECKVTINFANLFGTMTVLLKIHM